MIFGIGTDVLKVERVEQTWQRFGEHFARRLLLDEELAPVRESQAARAVSRDALRGQGSDRQGARARVSRTASGCATSGMVPNKLGQPQVMYSARGRAVCRKLGVGEGHLTLSDEAGLIVAVAVLMRSARTGEST